MIELIFATNNRHKADEIQQSIGKQVKIITLSEAGIEVDIPEPHDTIEANASEKSKVIYQLTGKSCFAEDTALEVNALNGRPGVKSARYAGTERDFSKNVEKLLLELNGNDNRRARFRTVISLIYRAQEHLFEGICDGAIGYFPKGTMGFGYDPVFVPSGSPKTFAELTLAEKNAYSHRSIAADKLVSFLQQLHGA